MRIKALELWGPMLCQHFEGSTCNSYSLPLCINDLPLTCQKKQTSRSQTTVNIWQVCWQTSTTDSHVDWTLSPIPEPMSRLITSVQNLLRNFLLARSTQVVNKGSNWCYLISQRSWKVWLYVLTVRKIYDTCEKYVNILNSPVFTNIENKCTKVVSDEWEVVMVL